MEEKKKTLGGFASWFGIGSLLFGTYCGANMASGVYASAYIVTKGGGWAIVWLLMFCGILAFFCSIILNFIRCFKADNYNAYYLSLYGLNKPDSNPLLKAGITVFFDCFTLFSGCITTSATIALFGELMNSLFHIPVTVAGLAGMILFAAITMYGAAFLRRFNTVMTISLLVCLGVIFVAVMSIRGDIFMSRLGNFSEGADWNGTTVAAHFSMFATYCLGTSNWGATLCNYSDRIKTQKDAIGSGITCGILVTLLFAITGAIVLPFMPEALKGTPILMICQNYLPKTLMAVYWVVVIFSVVSTAPTFTYNVANRWSRVIKTEKLSQRSKIFIIAITFLGLCYFISGVGLMNIVRKGYMITGSVSGVMIAIPLLISIPRVYLKDRKEKEEKLQK